MILWSKYEPTLRALSKNITGYAIEPLDNRWLVVSRAVDPGFRLRYLCLWGTWSHTWDPDMVIFDSSYEARNAAQKIGGLQNQPPAAVLNFADLIRATRVPPLKMHHDHSAMILSWPKVPPVRTEPAPEFLDEKDRPLLRVVPGSLKG